MQAIDVFTPRTTRRLQLPHTADQRALFTLQKMTVLYRRLILLTTELPDVVVHVAYAMKQRVFFFLA